MNERNKDAEQKKIALFLALTICQAFGYEVLKLDLIFSNNPGRYNWAYFLMLKYEP